MRRPLHEYLLSAWFIAPMVALMCGFIWRLEVECHGWAGLKWISYFHWAIPAGAIIFLTFVNVYLRADLIRRIIFNVLALILMYFLMTQMYRAYGIAFNSGPSAFVMVLSMDRSTLQFYQYFAIYSSLLFPLLTYAMLRIFGQKLHWGFLLAGLVVAYFSSWISYHFLEWVHHKGGSDHLHGLKSGALIVLWALSAGIVVVGADRHNRRNPKPFPVS